jgi:hypothetical protein
MAVVLGVLLVSPLSSRPRARALDRSALQFMVGVEHTLRRLISAHRRHHLGHLEDRLHVGGLEDALQDARLLRRHGRLGGLVEAAADLAQSLLVGEPDHADPADHALIRRHGAISRDRDRAGVELQDERRAAVVEYRVAGAGHELAGLAQPELTAAAVAGTLGRLDREVAGPLDRQIERIAGRGQGAGAQVPRHADVLHEGQPLAAPGIAQHRSYSSASDALEVMLAMLCAITSISRRSAIWRDRAM